jgi:iron complex outermembrane receptor protein
MKRILFVFIVIILSQSIVFSQQKSKTTKNDSLTFQAKEIVITGLRYPERNIEVPLAISVLERKELEYFPGTGIDGPLKLIPGILAQSRAGTNDVRITIRGFGARGAGDRSNAGTSRGIKYFLNGIPQTEPDGRTSFDFLEIPTVQKIEVVRSNASALWGNAAGGVVSFSTIPDYKESLLNFSSQLGSFGYTNFMVNGASKMQSGYINSSISYNHFDGWRQNSESERYLFNFGLTSNLSQNTSMLLFMSAVSNKFNIPGPLTQTTFDNSPDSANATYLIRKERRFNRAVQVGVNLDHNFDENNAFSAMLFVNPKFLQRSERNTFRDFTRYHLGGNFNFKNTFNIADNIVNTFFIGADEQYQDGAILFYSLLNGERGTTLKDNKSEGANNYGLFAQDEINISKNLSVLLGVRYDNVTYYSESFMTAQKENKTFDRTTPKLGITYLFDNSHSVYFNLGGGIEVPAGNETDPSPNLGQDTVYLINPLLDPIISRTYELGSKNYEYFNSDIINAISYEASIFLIDIENDIIPYQGGKFYMTAGKSQRIGFEVGVGSKLFNSLDLNVNLTFMNSKYVDYKVDSVHYDPKKAGIFADYSDNKIAGIPDLIYNLTLKYSPEFFDYAFLQLNFEGVGKYFADDANKYEVPSYNIINLRIGTTRPIMLVKDFGFNLFFTANNLTDAKYAASSFINPEIDKTSKLPIYLEPGLPRNFVAGISLKF